ncbi:hypothetical protein N2152v2_005568 [Parachlorella kessleri]
MFYCSEKHRKVHWRIAHHEVCTRMALHMQRRQSAPAAIAFAAQPYPVDWQRWFQEPQASGLPLGGQLRRPPGKQDGAKQYFSKDVDEYYPQRLLRFAGWQLGKLVPQQRALHSWDDYYALRGIPQASPVAFLMDSVLTVYWALLKLRQLVGRLPHERPVTLHYLGAQKEVAQWPLFLELGSLLPSVDLQLHFIGPAVPSEADGLSLHVPSPAGSCCGEAGCSCGAQPGAQAATETSGQLQQGCSAQDQGQRAKQVQVHQSGGRVCLAWHQGFYHEVAPNLVAAQGPADMVVAPNAGLAAYPSWVETLQLLAGSMHSRDTSTLGGETKDVGNLGSSSSGDSSSDGAGGSGASSTECQTGGFPRPAVCLFTDFNEEAAYRARALCQAVLDGLWGDPPAGGSAGRLPQPQQAAAGGAHASCLPNGGSTQQQQEQQQGVPSSGVAKDAAARGGSALRLSSVEVNPFRSCSMMHPSDNALPTCSNGFAVWLAAELSR